MRFDTPYNQRTEPPHRSDGREGRPSGTSGARAWNSWWSRRSPNLCTNDNPPARIGIDAGSKTLKVVALDAQGDVVFAEYHRHRSDVRTSLSELLHDVIWRHGDLDLPIAVTGSAGIALAQALGLPFVQEVVAATGAVRARYPQADCVVELGGEDAKITYLTGAPEHRMNATCAGGTGDFIDGVASMLGVRTREMSRLALGSRRTYPIASRCAVFARADVRPLINAGAAKADIAQSALEAVVRQTLGGLACGRPIRGTVVFLGGPLEHIPALVMAFRKKLGLDTSTGIKPPDAHLFTAIGAAEAAVDAPCMPLSELERRIGQLSAAGPDGLALPPLFADAGERDEFAARHAGHAVARKRLEDVEGPLFLGFDAGSTSMKYALVDESGALVSSAYRTVEGDTVRTAQSLLEELLLAVEGSAYFNRSRWIARAAVTGYGEDLLRTAFGFDDGLVETVAHLRAAQHFQPDATFVLDIGGQDMKALWVRDGAVVDAVLNEACSSGCGAFVQSSAKSLNLSHDEFDKRAMAARHPIDLGAKCTVFMTSRVRHAQKTGADVADIAAGIAYSVVNNVMTRIIGAGRAGTLGERVVVQGGAFKSDAVLRAFENVTGARAIRPDAAHLMGAYGAALVARDRSLRHGPATRCGDDRGRNPRKSGLLPLDRVQGLAPKRRSARCGGCRNACALSIVDFGGGAAFVSGNRCARGERFAAGTRAAPARKPPAATAPNAVAVEQRLLAAYGPRHGSGPRSSVTVGILPVLNAYDALPFWHALVSNLGFSVEVPQRDDDRELLDRAAETVPSESVCHPAKLSHVRYASLAHAGADVVLMPRFQRGTRCPVACGYADVLANNASGPSLSSPLLHAIRPKGIARRPDDLDCIFEAACSWAPADAPIGRDEFDAALEGALREQECFDRRVEDAAERAWEWVRADSGRRLAVLAGRPYHADPALLHDIDRTLAGIGFAVVPAWGHASHSGALGEKPLWAPAKNLVATVRNHAGDLQAEVVAVRSFGCGYDAVSFDEARDEAAVLCRPFTELKVDEMSDTAHLRIRLRTLAFTSGLGNPPLAPAPASPGLAGAGLGTVTPDLCSTAKAVVEHACSQLDAVPDLSALRVPDACKDCLTDALPFELRHLLRECPAPILKDIPQPPTGETPACENCAGMPVGLVGNPLMVFNPALNDHVDQLLRELGCRVVYPRPNLVATEDVRYLDQLREFHEAGIDRVIYLQSFGCLKGHVQSRGALRELERLFPGMVITVIDYDPESSALNRENRIRLAVS